MMTIEKVLVYFLSIATNRTIGKVVDITIDSPTRSTGEKIKKIIEDNVAFLRDRQSQVIKFISNEKDYEEASSLINKAGIISGKIGDRLDLMYEKENFFERLDWSQAGVQKLEDKLDEILEIEDQLTLCLDRITNLYPTAMILMVKSITDSYDTAELIKMEKENSFSEHYLWLTHLPVIASCRYGYLDFAKRSLTIPKWGKSEKYNQLMLNLRKYEKISYAIGVAATLTMMHLQYLKETKEVSLVISVLTDVAISNRMRTQVSRLEPEAISGEFSEAHQLIGEAYSILRSTEIPASERLLTARDVSRKAINKLGKLKAQYEKENNDKMKSRMKYLPK